MSETSGVESASSLPDDQANEQGRTFSKERALLREEAVENIKDMQEDLENLKVNGEWIKAARTLSHLKRAGIKIKEEKRQSWEKEFQGQVEQYENNPQKLSLYLSHLRYAGLDSEHEAISESHRTILIDYYKEEVGKQGSERDPQFSRYCASLKFLDLLGGDDLEVAKGRLREDYASLVDRRLQAPNDTAESSKEVIIEAARLQYVGVKPKIGEAAKMKKVQEHINRGMDTAREQNRWDTLIETYNLAHYLGGRTELQEYDLEKSKQHLSSFSEKKDWLGYAKHLVNLVHATPSNKSEVPVEVVDGDSSDEDIYAYYDNEESSSETDSPEGGDPSENQKESHALDGKVDNLSLLRAQEPKLAANYLKAMVIEDARAREFGIVDMRSRTRDLVNSIENAGFHPAAMERALRQEYGEKYEEWVEGARKFIKYGPDNVYKEDSNNPDSKNIDLASEPYKWIFKNEAHWLQDNEGGTFEEYKRAVGETVVGYFEREARDHDIAPEDLWAGIAKFHKDPKKLIEFSQAVIDRDASAQKKMLEDSVEENIAAQEPEKLFQFTARDSEGNEVGGSRAANSRKHLKKILRGEQLTLIEARRDEDEERKRSGKGKYGKKR